MPKTRKRHHPSAGHPEGAALSPRNAPHRTKLSQHRSSRIVLAVHALLIGVVVCTAGAGAVGDPAPRERDASAAVFRAAKRCTRRLQLATRPHPPGQGASRSRTQRLRVSPSHGGDRPTTSELRATRSISPGDRRCRRPTRRTPSTHLPVTRPTGLASLPTIRSASGHVPRGSRSRPQPAPRLLLLRHRLLRHRRRLLRRHHPLQTPNRRPNRSCHWGRRLKERSSFVGKPARTTWVCTTTTSFGGPRPALAPR